MDKTRKETKSQLKKVEVTMDSLKRNYDSLQKQLANEKAKRKKLEKQVKEHQAPVEEAPSTSRRKNSHSTHFRTAGAGRQIYHHRQGGRMGGRIPYNNTQYCTDEEVDVAFSGRGGRGRGGRGRDFRPPLKGRGHPSFQRRSNGKR
eukprot:scaffold21571_cov42-Cyclotella_meneghiniana.AAC.3